jgi:hypothetical protein
MILGLVVAAFGVLFTLQGVGIVKGSFMSNTTTWTILGPIIAVAGASYAYRSSRNRR